MTLREFLVQAKKAGYATAGEGGEREARETLSVPGATVGRGNVPSGRWYRLPVAASVRRLGGLLIR